MGLIQSVEGINRQNRLTFPREEGIVPADCLWSQTATLPWPSSLLASTKDLGFTSLHTHISQSLKYIPLHVYTSYCIILSPRNKDTPHTPNVHWQGGLLPLQQGRLLQQQSQCWPGQLFLLSRPPDLGELPNTTELGSDVMEESLQEHGCHRNAVKQIGRRAPKSQAEDRYESETGKLDPSESQSS